MILYLDASALVKRYIAEKDSDQVAEWIATASQIGTNIISRTEVSAAIARARRATWVAEADALKALEQLRSDWEHIYRLPVLEATVIRGEGFAWQYGLRGYDAIHLAAASLWQEMLGVSVTVASFDQQLSQAALGLGHITLP